MGGLNNLKPERVLRVFQKCGWNIKSHKGSHVKLVKEGVDSNIILPIHKGKPIKAGIVVHEIRKAGITVEEFLKLYE